MAREFRLPDIGEGLTEAEIVRWLVAEGDTVVADQAIVEVETDKAVVEIPSPYAGVVLSHGGAEGDVIEVGQVLVTIGEPGETLVSSPSERQRALGEVPGSRSGEGPWEVPPPGDGGAAAAPSQVPPIVGSLSEEAESLSSSEPETPTAPTTVKALPLVRKLARENGIDLTTIRGSGPGGRITRSDVKDAMDAAVTSPSERQRTLGEVPSSRGGGDLVPEHGVHDVAVGAGHGVSDEHLAADGTPTEAEEPVQDERRPMSRLRRTIAANMAKSWAEIPHVTTFDDVDATRLLEVRQALGKRHGVKIPLEALLIKAVLPALDEYPEFNASIDGDDLVVHGARDIGIAVDTPEGLIVAVIRNAEQKSVLDLASEVRRLGEGARERSLGPDELTGQTFTVSNIGAVGGGHGTPLIPYGTVAILSVGMARLQPIVYEEDLAIGPVIPLSISYDHRVIDGAVGRRFMALLMENLEEPALFLAD